MAIEMTKKSYRFGDIIGVYATVNGVTEFIIVPAGYEDKLDDDKLTGVSPLGAFIDPEPLMHIAVSGDGYSGDFTPGTTNRNSETASTMKLLSQNFKEENGVTTLVSEFEGKNGLIARQYVVYHHGNGALEMYNEAENRGDAPIELEALPSFNISRISPFQRFDDPEKLILHKLISNWSGEGKLYSVPLDKIAFESSWSGLGIRMEKWCQTGTMPARCQLPFAAVEDTQNGVCWAATIEAPASWEIEIVHRNNGISMGGGMSDYITGHWRKALQVGETLRTHKAFVTVVKGDLNKACDSIIKTCESHRVIKPIEEDLPTMYNEWCYTWGTPKEEVLEKILPVAAHLGCKYFVVDAGWYMSKSSDWNNLGDWLVRKEMFPNGLKSFSDKVNAHGMRMGIWYEFESVTHESDVYKEHPDWLLTYNGHIVKNGKRSFLDFRKQEVIDYLSEKVVKNLKDNNIGYMKVDYNGNVGLGVDGAESYGEGLRQHINGVIAFFKKVKESLPDLVLEVCSSGGMRHEPLFMEIGDIVSFSDAHENPGGVNVAFNLHRFMPPRKMLIWATIRDNYSVEDVKFTVAKAMVGRYCLSGNLGTKPKEIIDVIEESLAFYEDIKYIIKDGTTTVIEDSEIKSYLKPVGATYLVRESLDGKEKLVYAFAMDKPNAAFDIEVGGYTIAKAFNLPKDAKVENGKLRFTGGENAMWGTVVLMKK